MGHEPQHWLDDLVTLMTLTYVSCEFDAGTRCEGELRLRVTPQDAERLKSGDVYSMHIRRL